MTGAEDLFARIAERAFELLNDPRTTDPTMRVQGANAHCAVGIFDFVESLQKEARVRELRARIEDTIEFHDWLGNHMGREHRKTASVRCRVFGMSTAQATDQLTLSFGMRLGAMAQQVAEGAGGDKEFTAYREIVFEFSKALLESYYDLVKTIPNRPKDKWREEEIAAVRANRGEEPDEAEAVAEDALIGQLEVHPENERTYRTCVYTRDARTVPPALLLLADIVVHEEERGTGEHLEVLKKATGEIYWVGRCDEALNAAGADPVDKVSKILR